MTDLTTTTVPRRSFLRTVASLGAAVAAVGVPATLSAESRLTATRAPFARPNGPDEALQRLMDGNDRFAQGAPQAPHRDLARLREVEPKQTPFAAFLGCADSRVPIEIVFDQGFGDLFPVRVAGNIVSPEIIASLEFGCAVLGAQMLVVLGHSKCGAVKATLDGGAVPGQISTLYQHIQPAVDASHGDLDTAVAINVRNQASLLRKSSPVLAGMIKGGTLRIVGAVYDLASGRVALLDA
jgi:carbonic anhydrase